MKWMLTALLAWGLNGLVWAQPRYWDADYDSLARTLPRQRTDSARLRTVLHLLDLHPTHAQAVPLISQLLVLNQRLRVLPDDGPYRRLRAGLLLWRRGTVDAVALTTLKAAVADFDRVGRPIPWLLMDLVTLYNRLNRMAARKQYYDQKLAYYRRHEAPENVLACHVSQGGYYRRMGDYHRTLNHILRAADLARPFSRTLYTNELLVAGAVYADWGNATKAVQYLRQAQVLPAFRRVPSLSRVFAFLALSKLYTQEHCYPAALQCADSALAVRGGDGYEQRVSRAYALVQKAVVLLQAQAPLPAGQLLRHAQQLADSLALPMSNKLGEFELDATWAQYYAARHDPAHAERRWHRAYAKATAAKIDRLRPRYLQQLAAFYDARGQPAVAQRYSRAYIALVDTFNAAQNTFHVAHYEGERLEQAQNTQIAHLRQQRAVQAERLRLGKGLLLGALLAIVLVSGLGVFIYRQLRVNRRTLVQLLQTQSQLVQAEKMAFLGELTAGIAHELQNPLNFMKNFAEVSTDLVDEMNGEGTGREAGLEGEILAGLKQNLKQISQHGQRASSIIKDMLAHSRTGTSQRMPTDLNALATEALTLAYDGLRTTDPLFQATLIKEFDPALGLVPAVPPDLSRVLLNLCTNALHAVRERQRQAATADHPAGYEPTVAILTHRVAGRTVEIRVRDNGTGMSEAVRNKVFQAFFTTKPPGEGTGLGLSLSYDIVTKGHGGTLTVESREGTGTEFCLTLPA